MYIIKTKSISINFILDLKLRQFNF